MDSSFVLFIIRNLIDGKVFDSSIMANRAVFHGVIHGWTEALKHETRIQMDVVRSFKLALKEATAESFQTAC
jgi:FKBP-type peptidyl-prolyl cis-trans isomerase